MEKLWFSNIFAIFKLLVAFAKILSAINGCIDILRMFLNDRNLYYFRLSWDLKINQIISLIYYKKYLKTYRQLSTYNIIKHKTGLLLKIVTLFDPFWIAIFATISVKLDCMLLSFGVCRPEMALEKTFAVVSVVVEATGIDQFI